MKTNLSVFKYLCALCCLAAASWLTTASAQTKTVWVYPTGTYDTTTLDKIENTPVTTTAGAFSSNDYNSAVGEITGLESRVFKFGGGVFTVPVGYKITELTIYGWPRRTGATNITTINIDDNVVATFDDENPSPYIFADCGADVAPGNRTKDNCTIIKLLEVSATAPVTKTFKVDIKGETHAFCKLVLEVADNTGINDVYIDQPQSDSNDNAYYDLTGRKITNPTNGLYIQNGKKVIINQYQ